MTNTVTKQERDRINARAAQLYEQNGRGQSAAVEALITETGISRQRARTAVARAMLRANRPKERKSK